MCNVTMRIHFCCTLRLLYHKEAREEVVRFVYFQIATNPSQSLDATSGTCILALYLLIHYTNPPQA
jgi:hypothetical protein